MSRSTIHIVRHGGTVHVTAQRNGRALGTAEFPAADFMEGLDLIPSREQIAQALSVPDVHHPDHCDCGQPVCGGTCHAEGEDCYCYTERCDGLEQQVDAVLALLQGGTR